MASRRKFIVNPYIVVQSIVPIYNQYQNNNKCTQDSWKMIKTRIKIITTVDLETSEKKSFEVLKQDSELEERFQIRYSQN